MTFRPPHLVSFHSQIRLLSPDDILSTGNSEALVGSDGDAVERHIPGVRSLVNSVRQGER